MATLDHDDLQGFIARGYGYLPEAAYFLLHIEEAAAARRWLGRVLDLVPSSARKPEDVALHLACTREGLGALGMHEDDLQTFSLPFYEGMATERRARILGDLDGSDPARWRWGGPETSAVHVLLLLFARDAGTLEKTRADLRAGFQGVAELACLDTHPFSPAHEHFGFRDGIGQPILDGLSRTGPPENTLPPGEFILGYENDYGRLPAGPTVAPERDPGDFLPRIQVETERGPREAGDFGRNGSYLVFRQMSQDVPGFWRFIEEAARTLYGESDPAQRTRIAAKMVGRWPGGAPLAVCPEADDAAHATTDQFGYRGDLHGTRCPLGAHIRRVNPRDALEGPAADSIRVSNRHRLLRRGRPYGAPISRTLDVDEMLSADRAHEGECGLHFLCLNADLGRQFEFVQHTWIINAQFDGLYTDADPLLGPHDVSNGTFTLQREPVRERVTGMQRFVEVRGGAYFFLPGLRALRYLAAL